MAEKKQDAVVTALEKLDPVKVVDHGGVHKKFVDLYRKVHGSDRGELVYNLEKFHFAKLVQENDRLQKCTNMSLYGAFADLAVQNLSLDPTKKLAYLVPYGNKAQLQISGYGELQLRIQYGHVRHVDKPVLVYDCDEFEIGVDKTGKKEIKKYTKARNRPKDAVLTNSFIRIVRNDGSIEIVDFDASDFSRWRAASKQPNSPAWTTHYPSMIATKTVKHAFNTYPKIKIKGENTKLESQVDEDTEDIDYGLVDEDTGEVVEVKSEQKKAGPKAFGGEEENKTKTVSVDPEEYEGY